MNILIIRVSAIGDVIHTLPAVFLLKHSLPNARISWVVQKKAASLIVNQPFLDRVWVLPDNFLAPKNLLKTLGVIREMRQTQWDAIIDFQGLLKTTSLLVPLKGKKYGFDWKNAREKVSSWFTHQHVTPDFSNIIQKNLALASLVLWDKNQTVACPTIPFLQKDFTLQAGQDSKALVHTWIRQNNLRHMIVLCPNTTWSSKCWPLDYWKTLIHNALQQFPSHSLVLIGKDFGHDAAHLAQHCQEQGLNVHLAPKWDLLTTTYFLTQSDVIIAPDTSFLHCADFLGVVSIGLFGPTSSQKHGPFLTSENMKSVLQAPCKHFYQKTHGHDQDCMRLLTPDMVLEKIDSSNKSPGKHPGQT